MIPHSALDRKELFKWIHSKRIQLAGNARLKIYGKLNCFSGKRMRKVNRVFFANEREAIESGYRPCGHCMKNQIHLNFEAK